RRLPAVSGIWPLDRAVGGASGARCGAEPGAGRDRALEHAPRRSLAARPAAAGSGGGGGHRPPLARVERRAAALGVGGGREVPRGTRLLCSAREEEVPGAGAGIYGPLSRLYPLPRLQRGAIAAGGAGRGAAFG